MGLGGVSVTSLIVVLAIVLLLFGTKKLRSVGTDLGGAIRGFREAVRDGQGEALTQQDAGVAEPAPVADRQHS